jgi:hypothetical protein
VAMIICGSPAFFGLSRFMDANGDGLLFDLYPFIARARIGHGLDDAHVANAFFEVWTRPNAALRFDGSEKIFFHPPFALQFRRKIGNMQGAIAELAHLHHIGTEIVSKRAGAAINFQPVARRHGIDPAELEHAFGAIIERTKDSQ